MKIINPIYDQAFKYMMDNEHIAFDQKKISESKFILNIDEKAEDRDIIEIINYLHLATEDEEIIRKLEFEEEVENGFQKLEDELAKERKQNEEAKAREEEAKTNEREATKKLASKMKKYGEPIENIIAESGLSAMEIDEL